jgi:predicted phosphodiesterase
VARALRRLGLPALRGNHEAMLGAPPTGRDAVYQLTRCRAQLDEEEVAWLIGLPERMDLHPDGVEVRLCHGSPDDAVFGYVYPDTALESFDLPAGAIFVAGNTHRPMARRAASGALFCNPGSCGLPRDCGNLGAVGVLDAAAREFRVLRYDISATAGPWAARCAPVHQSVHALFAHRGDNDVVGEKRYE